ncbi:MAG TPA: CHRD domain-containing protein, partial [Bacillota bacterium]
MARLKAAATKRRSSHRSSVASSPRSGDRWTMTRSVSSQVFQATLSGFEEVPPRLTGATGRFWARLIDNGTALQYELRYENPTTPVSAAHIHFGQRGVNGEIMVFLCGGDDAPACPPRGGTVT